jgi:tRNA1Val (adenine37-N6)-methyltransferase
MKVCTDACLFGALTVNHKPAYRTGRLQTSNCLDIGAGTGLLSLIFAQKNPGAIIDAVEIDTAAAQQAGENFSASPWKERLNIINSDILLFKPDKKYNLIISNPPFYEDDLKSPDPNKNNAKHDTSLGLDDLLQVVKNNLSSDGSFAVLLPYHRVNYFIEEGDKEQLYLTQKILVKQTEKHDFFRGILFFSRDKVQPVNSEISIKNNEGNYSPGFVSALKDYYLYL